MYTVKINGKEAELIPIRVSAMPYNRLWPGKQRDISQSEIAYVLHIESAEPVNLSVEIDFLVNDAKVRPLSREIMVELSDNKVNFCLKKHGQYVLETNGEHNAIHIFYDKPEEYDASAAKYSFTDGEYHIGKLELDDNDSIYIGRNAVLYANIFAVGKKNIRIFGHGMLNGSCEVRTEKNGDIGWDGEKSFSKEKLHTIGCIRLINCEDILIDGVIVADSSSYAMSIYASSGICINNVKITGHWKYNNDGIDLINCSNAVIKNSFIRSFDDSICVKGFSAFSNKDCENITVENCVLWCGWGKTLEIGLATAAKKIKCIKFSSCDLIHNQDICISIANGQFADISDVLYKNINVEYEYQDNPVYQTDDSQKYEGERDYLPTLINITDRRRNWQGNISREDEHRSLKNVVFENINVICNRDIIPRICICSANKYSIFENINIKSIKIQGKTIKNIDLLSDEQFNGINIERNLT